MSGDGDSAERNVYLTQLTEVKARQARQAGSEYTEQGGFTWRERLYIKFYTTWYGRAWKSLIVLLSCLAAANFVAETRVTVPIAHSLFVVDIVLAFIFSLDLCLRLAASQNLIRASRRFRTLVDVITVAVVFSSWGSLDALDKPVTFNFLRATRVVDALVLTPYFIRGEVRQQLIRLAVILLVITFCSAGLFLTIERLSSDQWSCLSECDLQFEDAIYFIVVVFSTVGFGDISSSSKLGRLVVIFIIIIGIVVIPPELGKLSSLMLESSLYRTNTHPKREKFVLVTGDIRFATVVDFLIEYFHEDHGRLNIKVVILAPNDPTPPSKRLLGQPFFKNSVVWLNGSSMHEDDLIRAGAASDLCEAAFVTATCDIINSLADDVDARTILRCMSLRSVSPTLPIYTLLKRERSRRHLTGTGVVSFAVSSFRQRALATSLVCPGFSTMVSHFTHSTKPIVSDQPWKCEYTYAMGNELYGIDCPRAFIGLQFVDAARVAFQMGVTLIAVTRSFSHDQRAVLLAPRDYTLKEGERIFGISQNQRIVDELSRLDARKCEAMLNTAKSVSKLLMSASQKASVAKKPKQAASCDTASDERALSDKSAKRAAKKNKGKSKRKPKSDGETSSTGAEEDADTEMLDVSARTTEKREATRKIPSLRVSKGTTVQQKSDGDASATGRDKSGGGGSGGGGGKSSKKAKRRLSRSASSRASSAPSPRGAQTDAEWATLTGLNADTVTRYRAALSDNSVSERLAITTATVGELDGDDASSAPCIDKVMFERACAKLGLLGADTSAADVFDVLSSTRGGKKITLGDYLEFAKDVSRVTDPEADDSECVNGTKLLAAIRTRLVDRKETEEVASKGAALDEDRIDLMSNRKLAALNQAIQSNIDRRQQAPNASGTNIGQSSASAFRAAPANETVLLLGQLTEAVKGTEAYTRSVQEEMSKITRWSTNDVIDHIVLVMPRANMDLRGIFRVLRSPAHTPFSPIVILGPRAPTSKFWTHSSDLFDVFFVLGSPLEQVDLQRCNFSRAKAALIVGEGTGDEASNDSMCVDDWRAVLTLHSIKHTSATKGDAGFVLVELQHGENMKYFESDAAHHDTDRLDTTASAARADLEDFTFSAAFAAGKVWSPSLLNSILPWQHFESDVGRVIERLATTRSQLYWSTSRRAHVPRPAQVRAQNELDQLDQMHIVQVPIPDAYWSTRRRYKCVSEVPAVAESSAQLTRDSTTRHSLALDGASEQGKRAIVSSDLPTFESLFHFMIQCGTLVLALYRAPHSQIGATDNYVFTAPPPDTVVCADDRLIVLK